MCITSMYKNVFFSNTEIYRNEYIFIQVFNMCIVAIVASIKVKTNSKSRMEFVFINTYTHTYIYTCIVPITCTSSYLYMDT